ncbi:hypothetical protein L6452_35903 [Arctium lappa]|uniref:Uncharacterized protein n=1 Tax=Arctium lappa TaxID=4217 RepID=A0ACB8Y7Q6_ARCLA|nr:hypothetical protein L6452_35903 [Arctium lappa]
MISNLRCLMLKHRFIADDNLQVIKFGVRLIRDDDILQLKRHEYSTSLAVHNLFRAAFSLFIYRKWRLPELEADIDLDSSASIEKFFHEYGKQIPYGEQNHSLEGTHKIIKYLLETNQDVISECSEEWRHKLLFPFVYDYYRISHATSELYNDFLRLLKDASERWVSVNLALKHILIKSREDDDYTCEEMLQQLDDLEAAKSVRFSHNFVTSFARICKHAFTFTRYLNGAIKGMKKFKSMKVLAKVACMIIASAVSMVDTYIDHSELLYNMDYEMSNSVWSFIMVMSWKLQKWFDDDLKRSYDRELQIWDFYDNARLLQDLKKKMTESSVSKEEVEVMIDKLEKKIDNFSKTLVDMNSDAHKYCDVIREAGKTLNQFIADDKLWATKFCFRPHDDMLQMKRFVDPMREAVSKLFLATVFLPASLRWYIKGWKDNTIKSLLKSVLEHSEPDPFYGILHFLRCLSIHAKPLGFLFDYNEARKDISLRPLVDHSEKFMFGGSLIISGLKNSLEGICESWTSVILALEQILQKCRAGDYTYGEMLRQLNDLEATGTVEFSHEFIRWFEYICDATADFLRCMSLVINFTTVSLECVTLGIYRKKVSKLLKGMGKKYNRRITSILSIVATCMGDFKLLQEMEKKSWKFFHSIECFFKEEW